MGGVGSGQMENKWTKLVVAEIGGGGGGGERRGILRPLVLRHRNKDDHSF